MGLLVADRLDWEEAIAAEPHVPNLKTMCEQIAYDRELLAALEPVPTPIEWTVDLRRSDAQRTVPLTSAAT